MALAGRTRPVPDALAAVLGEGRLGPQFMQRVERYGAGVRITEGATTPVVTMVIPAQ